MANTRGFSNRSDEEQNTSPAGKNYFLGIGINDYAHFAKLYNARKDVEDVFAMLNASYNFDVADAEILTDVAATRNLILKKLKELRTKVSANDRLLIYYSGHGYTEDELGYWIPADAVKGEIGDYVSNSEVRELIKTIPAKHILLISDSCFSASLLVRDASRDTNSTFSEWDRHASRFVFISGKGVVSDGKQGENSPFAKAIINQLKDNQIDAVNIGRLADSVISSVRFNYEQQAELSPLFGTGHEGGQFVFQKIMSASKKEALAWQVALEKDTAAAYFDFIEKFPNAECQQEALERMKNCEDRDDFKAAQRLGGLSDFLSYLHKRPNGKFITEAKAAIDALRGNISAEQPTTTVKPPKKTEKILQTTSPTTTSEEKGVTPSKILKWSSVSVVAIIALIFTISLLKGFIEGIKENGNIPNSNITVTDPNSQLITESPKIGTTSQPTTTPATTEDGNVAITPSEQTTTNNSKGVKIDPNRLRVVTGISYQDVNAWNKINRDGKGTLQDYEAYLKEYPNGVGRNYAKQRIEEEKTKLADKGFAKDIAVAQRLINNGDYERAKKLVKPLWEKYPHDETVIKLWENVKNY
jgi:hypothetical protein